MIAPLTLGAGRRLRVDAERQVGVRAGPGGDLLDLGLADEDLRFCLRPVDQDQRRRIARPQVGVFLLELLDRPLAAGLEHGRGRRMVVAFVGAAHDCAGGNDERPIGGRTNDLATPQVGGKLAQLGQRLVNGSAKKLADEFFANFAEAVQGKQP